MDRQRAENPGNAYNAHGLQPREHPALSVSQPRRRADPPDVSQAGPYRTNTIETRRSLWSEDTAGRPNNQPVGTGQTTGLARRTEAGDLAVGQIPHAGIDRRRTTNLIHVLRPWLTTSPIIRRARAGRLARDESREPTTDVYKQRGCLVPSAIQDRRAWIYKEAQHVKTQWPVEPRSPVFRHPRRLTRRLCARLRGGNGRRRGEGGGGGVACGRRVRQTRKVQSRGVGQGQKLEPAYAQPHAAGRVTVYGGKRGSWPFASRIPTAQRHRRIVRQRLARTAKAGSA
jgi:hypothetical protein